MSKTAKGLLIAALCVLATWAGLSTLYTYSVAEELTMLRREERSDTVYLRCRIRELESELDARLGETFPTPSEPVGGEVTTERVTEGEVTAPKPAESEAATETEVPTESEGMTEDITLPTHNSPETLPPAETLPAAPYLVAAHQGIIGIFDATGALLRTANVYVMTLPPSDRAALEVGIPAEDWEAALSLLEQYE